MSSLAAEIAAHLEVHGYKSKVDGESAFLTENHVQMILDRAKAVLYDEEDGTTYELAHLMIMKSGEGFDVYLHSGEYT